MERNFKLNQKEVEVLKDILEDAKETQHEFLEGYKKQNKTFDQKYFEQEIEELEVINDISKKIK